MPPSAATATASVDAGQLARFAASLVDSRDSEQCLARLMDGLRDFVAIDNFIVFAYHRGFAASLVFSSLDLDYLGRQMAPYTQGLYLLDPFYVADMVQHRQGLLGLAQVMPEDFQQSEFYLAFYQAVAVLDELHYVVPVGPDRSVHVFLEREPGGVAFTAEEFAALNLLTPLVGAVVRSHWKWRQRALPGVKASPIHAEGGIEAVIRNMRPGELTPREVEVIGLALRGYASKLIARTLDISEGTVTNHKRNVYDKLGIHSQGQLFSLFLDALSRGAPGGA